MSQQPQYAQPYAPQPPKKSHTVRNVLLGIALLFVLVIGGCLALVGGGVNEVDKAIKEDANKAGGTDNALTIKEGEAFEVDGFKYAEGWSIGQEFGLLAVKGLKVTNERGDKDSALVEIKLWDGSEVLALSNCTSEPIAADTTTTIDCSSGDKLPKGYDKVTINDMF